MVINSPSHAIELLGGTKVVAGEIDRPVTTVSSWASRQSIPVDVWPALIDLAKAKGVKAITYEGMVKAHAADKRPRDAKRRAA